MTTIETIEPQVRTLVPLTPGIDRTTIEGVLNSFRRHDGRWFAPAKNAELQRCAEAVALLARGLGMASRLASAAPGTALMFSDDELYAAVPLDGAKTDKLIAELRG